MVKVPNNFIRFDCYMNSFPAKNWVIPVTFIMQTSCNLIDQIKEKVEETEQDERVQQSIDRSTTGIDKAKESIESAKEVKENVEHSGESLKEWNELRLKRKKKRRAKIAKLSEEKQRLFVEKESQFETDVNNARVVVIDNGHFLTCELQPITGTFERFPLGRVDKPTWFFNGAKQNTMIRRCASSGVNQGVDDDSCLSLIHI